MKAFLDSVPYDVLALIWPISGPRATPLAYAVSIGLHLYIVEPLDSTPNLLRESRDSLLTYLICAISIPESRACLQTARLLLDNRFTCLQDPNAFGTLVLRICEEERKKYQLYGEEDVTIGDLQTSLAGLFLERGVRFDIGVQEHNLRTQCTPLHISTLPIVRLVLDKYAHVNALDSDKRTPLDRVFSRECIGLHWDKDSIKELYDLTCLLSEHGGKIERLKLGQ
jgi:hypothetical protein